MGINTAGLIRDDLKAAGIPLIDNDGNEIFFHSLRNSFISWLANSTTPAKVVQKLARHSNFSMTYDLYCRVLPETEQKAISFLPNIGNFVFATGLAIQTNLIHTKLDCPEQAIAKDIQETAFLANRPSIQRGSNPLGAMKIKQASYYRRLLFI
jgi:hypothetical protein